MRLFTRIVLALSLLICGKAMAQTDLSGTWQGKLAIDQNNKMTIQFILAKKPDGSYSVVLNSPDSGAIKNVSANAVKYSGGKLAIDVASLSGSYSGTVGKDAITGEYKQQGSVFPLVLTPYKKPDASSLKPLAGEWTCNLKVTDALIILIVFHFDYGKDGQLVGTFDQPGQGAKGLALSDITIEKDQVHFKIPISSGEFSGTLSGNSIKGDYKVSGTVLKMDLIKGKYEAPAFTMSPEEMKRLLGQWVGKLKGDKGQLATIIFRFEKTKSGKLAASSGCPEQAPIFLPISDLLLKDDQVSFKIPNTGTGDITFAGKLNNSSVSGFFTMDGKQTPITVTRGGSHTQSDMPDATAKLLLGKWAGKVETTGSFVMYVFRFEINKGDGKLAGYFDCAENGQKDVMITQASFADGQLNFKIPGFTPKAEYTGQLSNNAITGTWKLGESTPFPISFVKGDYAAESDVAESAEALKTLLGRWNGTLDSSVALRFKQNANGHFLIYFDPNSSAQSDTHLLVRKVSLAADNLSFVIPGPGWTYKGKVKGNKIEGAITRNGAATPLSWTKEVVASK